MSGTSVAPVLAEAGTPTPTGRPSSLVTRAFRLWRTRIGALLVLLLVAIAVLGPLVAPHGPSDFVAPNFSPPGGAAGVFGTDYLGQDVFSRFLYGGRDILFMAVVSTAIGLVLGVAIGLIAAYARNALDDVLMRAMDVIMAFPQIMLALVAVSLVGAQVWVIIAAIALTTAPRVARVARGAAQPVVERDFVAATESMGLSRVRILTGELLPNILGPMMVEASLRLTYSIGVIAALAFLGLSPDPNGANWGTMIQQNQLALATQPWAALAPILAIALLTMGTGLFGDGIARTAAGIDRQRGDE
ncbi:MAG TPA: ABC transporter permease [Nocardioidaceae bacterium]|jgi:peptide/nickel transport system permease protein|nr:ABC transporter permease [Nocardioidaceae bacterium]